MNTLVAIALGSLLAAPVPKDAPKDTVSLEGEWVLVDIQHGGESTGKSGTITIKGDKFTVTMDKSDKREVATFTFDPKANPMTIDIKPEGENIVIKGIFMIEKDKLTLCFAMDGDDRPKEFKTEKGNRNGILILERAKK